MNKIHHIGVMRKKIYMIISIDIENSKPLYDKNTQHTELSQAANVLQHVVLTWFQTFRKTTKSYKEFLNHFIWILQRLTSEYIYFLIFWTILELQMSRKKYQSGIILVQDWSQEAVLNLAKGKSALKRLDWASDVSALEES